MKKLKVYIDTSVIGGIYDEEFNKYSKKLFDLFDKEIYIPVLSTIVLRELENAPDKIKNGIEIFKNYEILELTIEAEELALKYITDNIITKKYLDDALHIAIATINNIDVLVSWNFKHIVNLNKIHRFNAINLKEGYNILEIRSPMEVIENE